jgi:hypothetical protein
MIVIGDRPPEPMHRQIMIAFQGTPFTIIPYGLLMDLFARKLEENAKGSYREHHRWVVLKRQQKGKKRWGKK